MLLTGRRPDRAERRRLAQQDRVSARLAELSTIQTILADAQEVLGAGWAQGTWATYDGVCLVTSVRDAGGGGQRTARALDLVWHTLYRDEAGIRWVAPPDVRLARVRDLARWNDRAERRLPEVLALLAEAVVVAGRERVRLWTSASSAASVRPSSYPRSFSSSPMSPTTESTSADCRQASDCTIEVTERIAPSVS
jgi:hypothetical protein